MLPKYLAAANPSNSLLHIVDTNSREVIAVDLEPDDAHRVVALLNRETDENTVEAARVAGQALELKAELDHALDALQRVLALATSDSFGILATRKILDALGVYAKPRA